MKSKPINSILSIIASALGMWILAGLWHNLILPTINSNVQAHHQGMGLMLAGYFILAILMFILYNWINKKGK